MNYKFNSQYQLGKVVSQSFSEKEVKNEPMLFSADINFATMNGGEITRNFLRKLSDEFYCSPDLIIDSRVHMLMPEYYPCIPGWHHDDVPRSRKDGNLIMTIQNIMQSIV